MKKNKLGIKELKKVKKEVHKILYTLSSIEQKGEELNILGQEYELQIGLAEDGYRVFGVFVSKNGKPLFAETTNEFKKNLQLDKEEFYNKLDNIKSQVMWSIEKIKKETFELAKEYEIDLSFDEKNNIIVNKNVGNWLFFLEF